MGANSTEYYWQILITYKTIVASIFSYILGFFILFYFSLEYAIKILYRNCETFCM